MPFFDIPVVVFNFALAYDMVSTIDIVVVWSANFSPRGSNQRSFGVRGRFNLPYGVLAVDGDFKEVALPYTTPRGSVALEEEKE